MELTFVGLPTLLVVLKEKFNFIVSDFNMYFDNIHDLLAGSFQDKWILNFLGLEVLLFLFVIVFSSNTIWYVKIRNSFSVKTFGEQVIILLIFDKESYSKLICLNRWVCTLRCRITLINFQDFFLTTTWSYLDLHGY